MDLRNKRVVVFGIFDGVHEGHRDFFLQARRSSAKRNEGGSPDTVELIAVIGRDSMALKLKNKKPRHSENERMQMVSKEKLVDRAVLGDKELSVYKVLEQLKPDIICFGYDQQELKEDLSVWLEKTKKKIEFFSLKPYKQELLHSSKLLGKT